MNFQNPVWGNVEQSIINMEVEHPELGWIDYTATNGSGETEMQQLWDDAVLAGPAAYSAPPPVVPDSISFKQMILGFVAIGWATEAEAEAWRTGTLPAAIENIIGFMSAGDQLEARLRMTVADRIYRSDNIVDQFGSSQDVDSFFITAGAL